LVLWFAWAAVCIGVVGATVTDADRPPEVPREPSPWALPVLGSSLVLFAVHFTASPRYRRWAASLPFKLEGWLAVLGGGRAAREAELVVRFKDTRPPKDVVVELLRARVPMETKLTIGDAWVLRNEHLSIETGNQPVASWLRTVVTKVLLDVHRAYPIDRVALRVTKYGEFHVPNGD
jgi:hypothetical protein